jgi:hypothetical protein
MEEVARESVTTRGQHPPVIQNSGTRKTGNPGALPGEREKQPRRQGVSSVSMENDSVGYAVQVSM